MGDQSPDASSQPALEWLPCERVGSDDVDVEHLVLAGPRVDPVHLGGRCHDVYIVADRAYLEGRTPILFRDTLGRFYD